MHYAIRPKGVGRPVGFRAIDEGWPLAEGETFVVEEYPGGMVLALNGTSLMPGSLAQLRVIPDIVTNYQGRSALIAAGLFASVKAFVNAEGEESLAYQAFEYANHWERNSPLIVGAAAALGLTGEQLDDLFFAAAQIS